jgi:hypothetical protein
MATGVMRMTENVDLGIDKVIEAQRDLVRRGEITKDNGQGGYTVLGPMITLRYERTAEHPDDSNRHLRPDLLGNCVDWGNAKNGPLIGLTRAKDQALIVTACRPLPDVPDPTDSLDQFVVWNHNRVPLASIPPPMRAGLKNSDGTLVEGTDTKLRAPRTIKQRYADHSAGIMGAYIVIRPITEALVKLAGISALQKVEFLPVGNNYPGFYIDPETGEAFFVGGKMELK